MKSPAMAAASVDPRRRHINPFRASSAEDACDAQLVAEVRAGSAPALEELVSRHQGFLYNIALRMLCSPPDAQDATQEILLKAITKLDGFEGRSSFRTWLYRIAVHHVLNFKRGQRDFDSWTFVDYGEGLTATPDLELPDASQVPVELKLLVDEARLGCTTGMLLCLDRRQRLVYILGEIFGTSDAVGALLLELSTSAFRQQLARARRDLHAFLHERCGLVNPQNPCRCAKKTRAFMAAGYVDADRLRFARQRVTAVRTLAPQAQAALTAYDGACTDVYADHPFYEAPDVAAHLRQLIETPSFRATFELGGDIGSERNSPEEAR